MTAAAVLALSDVEASYGPVRVLRGVDLSVKSGEVRLLIGRNGSGKSTTLKAIAGLIVTAAGDIRIDGVALTGLSTRKRLALGAAFVPQAGNAGRGVFPHLTVRENLEVMALVRSHKRVDYTRAWRLFPELEQFETRRATSMSGGQQQMLAVAMAMMTEPRLLLLDEPTCGLARGRAIDLMKVLRRLASEQGLAVLIVEQNVVLTLDHIDSVSALRSGRVVAEVKPDRLGDPAWLAEVL
jgi:ABC-type branched-subunit amino acid transport system ATPase component